MIKKCIGKNPECVQKQINDIWSECVKRQKKNNQKSTKQEKHSAASHTGYEFAH